MLDIALRYCETHGSARAAIPVFVADLMRGDPDTLKAGYTRGNAVIAAAEAFGVEPWRVEEFISTPIPEDKMPVIKFDDDAVDSMIRVLNGISLFTIQGEWTNDGFPSDCSIVKADDEGVTICEVDDTGSPIINATWLVGYDEIISITIL